jgi:hypothetical protein
MANEIKKLIDISTLADLVAGDEVIFCGNDGEPSIHITLSKEDAESAETVEERLDLIREELDFQGRLNEE